MNLKILMEKLQKLHCTDIPMDYHVWGGMLECYQRYTPKPANIAKLKDYIVNDVE